MSKKTQKKSNLFTISQFAWSLSMHPDTVRRWANAGKIDYVTTKGGHRRFNQSELDKIISGVKHVA